MNETRPDFSFENEYTTERVRNVNNLPKLSATDINRELDPEFVQSDLYHAIDASFEQGTDHVNSYRRDNDKKLVLILKHKLQDLPEIAALKTAKLTNTDTKNIAPYIHDFIQEKRDFQDTAEGIIEYLTLAGKI